MGTGTKSGYENGMKWDENGKAVVKGTGIITLFSHAYILCSLRKIAFEKARNS